MLIDSSYFIGGSRQIENAEPRIVGTVPSANSIRVNEVIEAYIAELEPEFFENMLGSEYACRLTEYISSQKDYALLRRTDAFFYRGDNNGYMRIFPQGEVKPSVVLDEIARRLCCPLADYVFFHILRFSDEQATITGLVRLKCANEYVSPIRRQVDVWNAMVDKNRRFAEWIADNRLSGVTVSRGMLEKINIFNI